MNIKRSNQKNIAHIKAANAYAELSYARRLKVGAVIVRDDRIVSIGYNGTPAGRDNNCEWLIWPGTKIKNTLKKLSNVEISDRLAQGAELLSKDEVCHAEMNAIMFAAKNGVSTDNCSLYVTHSPCFECAKMIVQCGINTVFYEQVYRDDTPIKFLTECNVRVIELKGD